MNVGIEYVAFLRIGYGDTLVIRVNRLSEEDYKNAVRMLEGHRWAISRIPGLSADCITYYDIGEDTVKRLFGLGEKVEPV